MPISNTTTTVNDAFFNPLTGLVDASPHTRPCPTFPDEDFLHLGVQRVLETSSSGRAFLQEHGLRFDRTPELATYFAAFRSSRRRNVLRDVSRALVGRANPQLPNRLMSMAELAGYECFAADGHWHGAAAHDQQHREAKVAVGHFYSLNLRTHILEHLAVGQGLHEHDMSALKRVGPKGLRQRVPKGRRVLIVYDKAGIDFHYWKRCRHECAVYFISRVKEGMVFDVLEKRDWDRSDPRNHGVQSDCRVMTRDNHQMRIVEYIDPISGEWFEFLTNEPDLPPGVIVELYRRRWEAEKVFDEIKNKLGEQKAWATSLDAKESQAQMVAITHNLLVLYEAKLEVEHGVTNHAEDARRARRNEQAEEQCRSEGKALPVLALAARKATQRSVKFIRCIRQSLRDNATEAAAVHRLRGLYAVL